MENNTKLFFINCTYEGIEYDGTYTLNKTFNEIKQALVYRKIPIVIVESQAGTSESTYFVDSIEILEGQSGLEYCVNYINFIGEKITLSTTIPTDYPTRVIYTPGN